MGTAGAFMFVQLKHHDAFDEFGAGLCSIIWPAVLPLSIGYMWGKRFYEWRTRPDRVKEALRGKS